MTYYKFLMNDGVPRYGTGKWFLPTDTEPGEWMPIVKDIKLCESGYHFCANSNQLRRWIAPKCYEIEIRGEVLHDDDKSVAQEARLVREFTPWNERTMRLFACDCAERVLRIYEGRRPNDKRVRGCIEAARDYANGKIQIEALRETRDAAAAAANAADYPAAAAAAYPAAAAAYAAAAAAAYAAAYAAAADADADAAYAAAYAAAAYDAAYAAAAYAAAADADADAAARQEEKDWQNQRILQYLNGEVV